MSRRGKQKDDINEQAFGFNTRSMVKQLMKPVKEPKGQNYIQYYKPTEVNIIQQADLLYLPYTTKQDPKYLLVVIDTSGLALDFEQLKDRGAGDVVNAFKKIYKRKYLKIPKMMRTDKGGEFDNEIFKKYLKQNGIEHIFSRVGRKSQMALVERLNEEIGTAIFYYLNSQEVKTGTTITKWNHLIPRLREILNERYKGRQEKLNIKRQKMPYQPPRCQGNTCDVLNEGDYVRVAYDYPRSIEGIKESGKFRAGDLKFSVKPYKIERVIIKPDYPPMYKIEDIPYTYFNRNQLLVASKEKRQEQPQDIFIIDKIIRRNKNNSYRVKWKDSIVDEATKRKYREQIDKILKASRDEEGNMKYLIKWKITTEPASNISKTLKDKFNKR